MREQRKNREKKRVLAKGGGVMRGEGRDEGREEGRGV